MKKSSEIDYNKTLSSLEKFSPLVARKVLMKAINFLAPFNGHLKSQIKVWTDQKVVVGLKLHRGVKNHLGSVHAGALFTLSESSAGILLIRNFNLKKYRLIMEQAAIEYFKQARGECEAVCEITPQKVEEIKKGIQSEQPFQVILETKVYDLSGEHLCSLKTYWQIKPWDQVKTK